MQFLLEDIERYALAHSRVFDERTAAVLAELERITHLRVLMPRMLSGPLQGQWLAFFSRMIAPKKILEIGTFTGYSAICLAQGLTEGGLLHSIDINDELRPLVEEYREKAGLSDRICLHWGTALDEIDRIEGTFDLVFIDADKANYLNYYHKIIDRVRPGGYILADNVLWSGKVTHTERDATTEILHRFNEYVHQDGRVRNFLLPIRDGLMLLQRL